MSTVTGKTSAKIDELIGNMIVAGVINGSGQLILTQQDGGTINAGTLTTPLGEPWSSATAYTSGDVVGYAGGLWRALSSNTDKPPTLFSSIWRAITGTPSSVWMDKDSFFVGDSLSQAWDTSYKVGAPTVALTTNVGEHESGKQALKISLSPGQQQGAVQKVENIVRGNETIVVKVRAKVTSLSAGSDFAPTLIQSDGSSLVQGGAGVTTTVPAEGYKALTTSWTTYTFTITSAVNLPRGAIALLFRSVGNAATMLVDWIRTERFASAADQPLSLLTVYPVGAIYMSVVNTSPATLFGGTWAVWGTGRVAVGVDTGNASFNTVEETGGTLTHVHDLDSGDSRALIRFGLDGEFLMKETVDALWESTRAIQLHGAGSNYDAQEQYTSTSLATRLRGSSDPAGTLPPYITCYMWKRTA